MTYQQARDTRREYRTVAGRFRSGKLAPVLATAVRESEGGILSQNITCELDPVAGRLLTPVACEVVSVFVPVQAMHALANPEDNYAGNTEVIRDLLLSGTPLFGLEAESEISKRLGVVPKSIGGVKKVTTVARLAHNAAVNYLRLRKYVKATTVASNNFAITPALIGETVLDRLNGVLDPEDRVNGAVNLSIPNMVLPVSGVGSTGALTSLDGLTTGYGDPTNWSNGDVPSHRSDGASSVIGFKNGIPDVYATLIGAQAGSVSLTDFYNAELADSITRNLRQIVDENPEYGEEMAVRFAHGLSVDAGRQPFEIYRATKIFGQDYRQATDGANLDQAQTDLALQISFTTPVPKTELGGVIVTFASVKPDETLASQPHPILSEPWGVQNYVSDELARDPVPVTIRELYADCEVADEETRVLYVGHNHLKRSYVNYGFNRHVDPTTVESQNSIWTLEIPMSVTPDSVIYPAQISQYPFQDALAEICTYVCSSTLTLQTPMIFGPTPVEELAAIEDADVFGDGGLE